MSSRKNPRGCRTIACIKKAVALCGCSVETFFARVGQNGRLDVPAELSKFRDFEKFGVAVYPHYEIPNAVIALAEKVLEQKDPRNFFRNFQPTDGHFVPARPTARTHAHA